VSQKNEDLWAEKRTYQAAIQGSFGRTEENL